MAKSSNYSLKKRIASICMMVALLLVEYVVLNKASEDEIRAVNEIYQVRIRAIEDLIDERNAASELYLDFSIDDTIDVFEDLNSNRYKSIFDNSLLSYLRSLHNLYGLKVVLYCFYENSESDFNLTRMTDGYKSEFQANSSWLKLGFHSLNGKTDYSGLAADRLVVDYDKVVRELIRFSGEESLSHVVRLHGFHGSKQALSAISSSLGGVKCYLTADDNRISYELTEGEIFRLDENELINIDGLNFVKSDLRIENIENIEGVLNTIISREDPNLVVFTHERKLSNNKNKAYLEKIVRTALESNYYFDFVRWNQNDCDNR